MEINNIGITFSGGGVRGCAHIGVIKALEELQIHPEIISGTSAGAVVGSLYAAGYNSNEIFDFFSKTSLFSSRHLALTKFGILDAEKFASEFEKYLPSNSFESLKKKLFVITTDLEHAKIKIFSSGKLIRPILASSAIPFLVSPVEIDGQLYSDGGIIDNFPTDVLKDKCKKTIGVYVNPLGQMPKKEFRNGLSVLKRAYHIGASTRAIANFKDCTVLISPPDLHHYSTLEMSQSKEIFDIGYQHAMFKAKDLTDLLD
tara:strand:- start:103 stop:876 length:774 start_codon:yes stop_codon:yes gene_type:complete